MKTLEALEKYLDGKQLNKSTQKLLKRNFALFAEKCPELPIYSGDLNSFIKWAINEKKQAPITVQTCMKQIRAVYHYLYINYDLNVDFLKKVERVKVPSKQRRYFQPDIIVRIIQACRNNYDLALILTITDSLSRIGELGYSEDKPERLCALRGRDIEFFNEPDGTPRASIKVYAKGNREITHRLDPDVAKMLLSLAGSPDSFVFKQIKNADKNIELPATSHALSMRVKHIMLRAGLKGEKLAPHTLRHSGASLVMKNSNGNLHLVGSMLGHSADSKQTKVYVHDWEESLSQTVSPLQLVKDTIKRDISPTQANLLLDSLTPEDSKTALVKQETIVTDNTPNPIIESMFNMPAKDSHIRPLLKYEDLLLFRRACIYLTQFSQITTDANQARDLYKRITRLNKSIEQEPTQPDSSITNQLQEYIIK